MKFAIAGAIVGIILLLINPWLGIAVIALAIGIPTALYLALDPSQRRRIKAMRDRQIRG